MSLDKIVTMLGEGGVQPILTPVLKGSLEEVYLCWQKEEGVKNTQIHFIKFLGN